jgi:hypothetical protein
MNWIAVKDELPPERVWILGCGPYQPLTPCFRCVSRAPAWSWHLPGASISAKKERITHWMHQPKPPIFEAQP